MVARRALVEAVDTRLKQIPNLQVFLNRPGNVYGEPDEVPVATISDNDKRVHPYVVQYPFGGVSGSDTRVDGQRVGLNWSTQITIVTGDEDALDLIVDHVSVVLDEWRPPVDGVTARMRIPADFDPGPARRDDAVSPARFWTPRVYRLHT